MNNYKSRGKQAKENKIKSIGFTCEEATEAVKEFSKALHKIKPKSKKQQILELLQTGYQLTKIQIRAKANLTNEGDTIFQLRKKHPEIKTRMEVNKSTKSRFAVYFIPKADLYHI